MTNVPTTCPIVAMTLLLLEALGAGLIFVGIIWWTMFSGRDKGELRMDDKDKDDSRG